MKIHNLNDKHLRIKFPELQYDIKPDSSKFQVKSNSITVTLIKEDTEKDWTDVGPKKGLQKAAEEVHKEKTDPDDERCRLMDMVKDMYTNGDDEFK